MMRAARSSGARLGASVVATLGTVTISGALAQDTGALEEIVVTAQKREQSVQDVGIAISAYTGEQLRALGVRDSTDVALITPGVYTGGALAGQNSQFTIRGVVQNDYNDIVESPNAVYIDEGYIANSNAQTFVTLDIERVEILKGPQGTLFGRNATGGLVHYITRKPSYEQLEGFADLEWGMYDNSSGSHDAQSYRLEAAIGGPFTDRFAARIAASYSDRDPYLTNLYPLDAFGMGSAGAPGFGDDPGKGSGADMGDEEAKAARGTLLWKVTDDVEMMLSASWGKTNVGTGPYQSAATQPVFNDLGEHVNSVPAATDFFGYRDPDGKDFKTSGDFAFSNQGHTESSAVNFQVDWEISDTLSFKSVTYYQQYEKLLFIDVDSAPVNLAGNYATADTDTLTQEFRLQGQSEKTHWTAGFYYLNIDAVSQNGLKFPQNSLANFDSPLGFGVPYDLGVDAHLQTDSYSLFGQLEYDLTDTLALVGGLRLIREKKDFTDLESVYLSTSPRTVHVGNPAFSLRDPIKDDSDDDLWAGKLQLEWRPSGDTLVYAGVNRGVKAGSFNAALPDTLKGPLPLEYIPYDPEELTSYEAGFKSDVLGGNTRINGSAFYYDYKDYQAFLFVSVGGYVINVDAQTVGAELEIRSSPVDGLDLGLSAAWFDAEVHDLPVQAGSTTLLDVEPTNAPQFQLTGLVRYAWDAPGGSMAIQSDASYADKAWYDIRNFDTQQFDSYWLLNAQLTWESADQHWLLSLVGRNLTDSRSGVQGYDLSLLCGCSEVAYRAPRWFGVSARYSL